MSLLRHLSVWLLLIVCLTLNVATQAATRPRIVIPAQAYATTELLTLASIAQITSEDESVSAQLRRVSLGYAPSVGASRVLTRETVITALGGVGFSSERFELIMPDSVTIERAAQTVSREQINQMVEQYVRERYAFAPEEVAIRPVQAAAGDVVLPQGELVIRPSTPSAVAPSERMFVSVALEVDGRVAKYLSVELNVEVTATVAVAARPLEPGEPLDPQSIRFERRRISPDARRYFTSEQSLVGKAAAISLREGMLLTTTMVTNRVLIKRGDSVMVYARAGRLEVSAIGEAKGGGRLGDRIEVLNRNTGRVVVGEIVNDKTVRVAF